MRQPLELNAMPRVKPVPDPDLDQIRHDCAVGRRQQSEFFVKMLRDAIKWLSTGLKQKITLGLWRRAD